MKEFSTKGNRTARVHILAPEIYLAKEKHCSSLERLCDIHPAHREEPLQRKPAVIGSHIVF